MALKKNIKIFFYATIQVVLAFVFTFNSFSSWVHLFEEHHIKTETCTSDDEKDACHRYIVHQEESASCNGSHQHITNKTHDCFLCKYLKDRKNKALNQNRLSLYYFVKSTDHKKSESELVSQHTFHSYSRGPPCFS